MALYWHCHGARVLQVARIMSPMSGDRRFRQCSERIHSARSCSTPAVRSHHKSVMTIMSSLSLRLFSFFVTLAHLNWMSSALHKVDFVFEPIKCSNWRCSMEGHALTHSLLKYQSDVSDDGGLIKRWTRRLIIL